MHPLRSHPLVVLAPFDTSSDPKRASREASGAQVWEVIAGQASELERPRRFERPRVVSSGHSQAGFGLRDEQRGAAPAIQ